MDVWRITMAINVTSAGKAGTAGGPTQETAEKLAQQTTVRPSTAVERLMGKGPVQTETVDVAVETKEEAIRGLARQRLAGEAPITTESTGFELPAEQSASPHRQPVVGKAISPQKRAEIEAQRERERIPAFSERTGSDAQSENEADAFGASIQRANKFSILFTEGLEGTRVGIRSGKATTESATDIMLDREQQSENLLARDILLNPTKFDAAQVHEDGTATVDPSFAKLMGFITENWIGQEKEGEALELEQELEDTQTETRYQGAAALGREIYREWQREQNFNEGRPTDEYTEEGLSNDEFLTVGALAKEMYAAANPDMYERISNQSGAAQFKLTPVGQSNINNAKAARPDAFINRELEPQPAPRAVVQEIGEGEVSRQRRVKTTVVDDQNFKN